MELLKKSGKGFKMLVDQGTSDDFYKNGELNTALLEEVAKEVGAEVSVRYREVGFSRRGEVRLVLMVLGVRSWVLLCVDVWGGAYRIPCEGAEGVDGGWLQLEGRILNVTLEFEKEPMKNLKVHTRILVLDSW